MKLKYDKNRKNITSLVKDDPSLAKVVVDAAINVSIRMSMVQRFPSVCGWHEIPGWRKLKRNTQVTQ